MAVALNSLSRFFFYYCRFSLSRHQKIKIIQYVKNLVYDRWQICKDPRQDSGQCNFANARYLGKWFTQKHCSLKSQFHIGVVQWRQRKYVPRSVKHLQGCRLANFKEKIVVCCWFYIIVAGATFGRLIISLFVLNKNKHNTLHLLVSLCCREEVDPPQL